MIRDAGLNYPRLTASISDDASKLEKAGDSKALLR